MKLTLTRKIYTDRSTIGTLDIDGVRECDTLEDMTRRPDVKIYGKTAIPGGAYKVVITHSNRFKKDLPLLLNVPNYEGVRIHTGNDDNNTEGCILVGTAGKQADWISGSVVAMNALQPKIAAALARKETVTLVIVDTFGDDKRTEKAKAVK